MILLVLRLIAVYSGAALICLALVRRFIRPIRFGVGFFLVLAPAVFTGKALITAGVYGPIDLIYKTEPLAARRAEMGIGPIHTHTLTDVPGSMVPWQKAVRESVKNGRLPLWNRFTLAGEPLLAVLQHGMLHPGTWLGFLLPLGQAWTFAMSLRIFLAMLGMYLFLREIGCAETASLFGAAAYAFCDYLFFFLEFPHQPVAASLPLLLLGLRCLAREPGRRSLGLTLAALLLLIAGGHPETLLHAVAGAGIYFLFELAGVQADGRLRSVSGALLAGGLALGLSAFLLLPFREAAKVTGSYAMRVHWYAKAERSVPLPQSLARSVKNVVPYAYDSWIDGWGDQAFAGPAAYGGSLLLPLACLGLGSRRRERWPFLIMGFLGLSTWARLPVVNDAICRLPLFKIAINEYMVFLAAFAVSALAAFGLDRLNGGGGRLALLVWTGIVLAVVTVLFSRFEARFVGLPPPGGARLFLAQAVPLLLLALVALVRWRPGPGIPLLALVLLLAQRKVEVGRAYATLPARAFYPPLALLQGIDSREPFRIAAVGYMFIPKMATLYELEEVRGDGAMTLASLGEIVTLWSVPQPSWFNRVDDPTRPFLSFLNVRYVIAPPGYPSPPGWRVVSEDRGGRLLENPNALPRAFVPRTIIPESDPGRLRERLLHIVDFSKQGVVEAPGAPERSNGEARVTIASYSGQKMEVEIEAREKALIATSMTGWPGWRLTVDGAERPLLAYNRAFLAFEVPAGRHRAVLRYWPRSFVVGLWISGLSLLCAVAYFLWPRRAPRASARSAATGEKVLAADQPIQETGSRTGSM